MTREDIKALLQKDHENRIELINYNKNYLLELFRKAFPENIYPKLSKFTMKICSDYYNDSIGDRFNSGLLDSYKDMLNDSAKKLDFEKIKEELNFITNGAFNDERVNENHIKAILETIEVILKIQLQDYADLIGCVYAENLNSKLSQTRKLDPSDTLEFIILKRHEICSNKTKGFGFIEDANIDALVDDLAGQTIYDLYSAKQVNTSFIKWINKIGGHGAYIDMKVSPVSRAVSTAMLATFELSNINQMTFDVDIAEQQWFISAIRSGRASTEPKEYVERMKKLNFYRASFGNNNLFKGETQSDFKQRVDAAVGKVLEHSENILTNLRINMTVAHGDINKSIISKLFNKFGILDRVDKLSFGEQYILVGTRDSKTKVLKTVRYLGVFDRYGYEVDCEQKYELYKEYFDLEETKKQEFIAEKKDALLDNLNTLVIRNKTDLNAINFLLNQLLKLQIKELSERPDNSSSSAYNNPDRDLLSNLRLYIKKLENLVSGKDPQVQKSSLDSLDSFISENKNTNGLKELYAQVKSKLSPGKVTKLIEAFIRLRMLEEELSVSTGSDNDQDLSSSENDDRKSPRRTR